MLYSYATVLFEPMRLALLQEEDIGMEELKIRQEMQNLSVQLPQGFAVERGNDGQHIALRKLKGGLASRVIMYTIAMLMRHPDAILLQAATMSTA